MTHENYLSISNAHVFERATKRCVAYLELGRNVIPDHCVSFKLHLTFWTPTNCGGIHDCRRGFCWSFDCFWVLLWWLRLDPILHRGHVADTHTHTHHQTSCYRLKITHWPWSQMQVLECNVSFPQSECRVISRSAERTLDLVQRCVNPRQVALTKIKADWLGLNGMPFNLCRLLF